MKSNILCAALYAACAVAPAFAAQSATSDYPNRPIRIIVPLAPGGGSDYTARFIGTIDRAGGVVTGRWEWPGGGYEAITRRQPEPS